MLAHGSRFSTDDLDGSGYPTDVVLAAAAEIAERRRLQPDWLHDSVKACFPTFKEPDWRPVFKVGTVEVVAADEQTLLAMKMRASGGRRDEVDIQFLLHKCGIAIVDEALALYKEYFPEDALPDRVVPMLRHTLEQLRMER